MSNVENKVQSFPMPETDWYLRVLVNIVTGNDSEFGITLYVDGIVVSGFLASGHRYFDGLAEQFNGHLSSDVIEALTAKPKELFFFDKNKDDSPLPEYIHLREARVFATAGQPIPQEGCWWRGRLASVSGFSLGNLVVSQS